MGRITDSRNEETPLVLAELFEPVSAIIADPSIRNLTRDGNATISAVVKTILEKHPSEVVKIIAIDDGLTAEEEGERLNPLSMMAKLMRLFATPEVQEMFFGVAATSASASGSSAASENGRG